MARDHQRSAKYKTAQATMITVTIRVLVFVKALSRSASVAAIATDVASILGVLGLVVFATAPSLSSAPRVLRFLVGPERPAPLECPLFRVLLGVKRTCRFALHMSAFDPKRIRAGRFPLRL